MATDSPKVLIESGNHVTFDGNRIEFFLAHTSSKNKEVQSYRKSLLATVNQVGIVKGVSGSLAVVLYANDLELCIPTGYLIVLPEFKL